MTAERYYRLTRTSAGRLAHDTGGSGPRVPRRFPIQWMHATRINDVRLWFERQPELGPPEFAAEWEFKELAYRTAVVPDGVVVLRADGEPGYLAVEVDCGTENPQMVARKVAAYRNGTAHEMPRMCAVLIWAPGWRRLRSILAACYRAGLNEVFGECIFGDLDQLNSTRAGSSEFVSLARLDDEGAAVTHRLVDLLVSPVALSSPEETPAAVSQAGCVTCEAGADRQYAGREGVALK